MRSIIGFTESRNASLERLVRFLSLVLPLLLLLFSLTLEGRRCVIVARLSLYRTGLSTICCRSLIIGLKCLSIAMYSSFLPVFRARFLRIARLLDLSRNFFHARAHQSCSSLAKYRQRLVTLQYRELVKSLSVSPIFKRTVLIYY